jgi:hypothetical protein
MLRREGPPRWSNEESERRARLYFLFALNNFNKTRIKISPDLPLFDPEMISHLVETIYGTNQKLSNVILESGTLTGILQAKMCLILQGIENPTWADLIENRNLIDQKSPKGLSPFLRVLISQDPGESIISLTQ